MTDQQFSQLAECNLRALRRFLVALCCGDLQMADDIAQETLIKAYLSLSQLRQPDRFLPWVFKIAHTTFLNCKRSVRLTIGYDEMPATAAIQPPADPFRYTELYAALGKIPAKERTAVLLYYMQGYAANEIARITSESPEAVRQQLSRARRHLRRLLTTI